jgi:hypothetical protein
MNKLLPIMIGIAMIGLIPLQVAYATNESSYKWGYSQAMAEHDCNVKQKNECMDDVGMSDVCGQAAATNETACNDGWAQAWANIGHETRAQALCDANEKYCAS